MIGREINKERDKQTQAQEQRNMIVDSGMFEKQPKTNSSLQFCCRKMKFERL